MHKVPEDHNPLDRHPLCGDPGALVSYLYNDGTPAELALIAAHVQDCDVCTRELAALGDTREQLSAWSPPQTELGFALAASDAVPVPAVVSDAMLAAPVPERGVPWWRQATPVWMQAVAATMVFGAGLAVGTSRGASSTSQSVVTPNTSQPATAVNRDTTLKGDSVSRGELAALEARLRAELTRSAAPAPTVQNASRTDDEALLKRMRSLVTDSEERQRSELALRTAQVLRDIEIQRKVDVATMQQSIGQIQGLTAADLKQQRELYNLLMNNASLRGGVR